MTSNTLDHLQLYLGLGLTPIPLKPRSKEPLIKWRNGWNPTLEELRHWATEPGVNWGIRCGQSLAALDFDDAESFYRFTASHPLPAGCPIVRTSRGFHIWVRPKKPIRSHRADGLELKCVGSYVVAPPSIHPKGTAYTFEVATNGTLPEIDLEELLGVGQIDSLPKLHGYESIRPDRPPSDFAIRYGKSSWPESMCGMATKVLTRSDGNVKKLVSMRCWKWDCPKCAPVSKRYWMKKLKGLPFRFIVHAPTWDKPTRFLRRLGNPPYVHMVDNGEGWIFLLDGDREGVWAEVRQAGYTVIAGDLAGDPTPDDIEECLDKALAPEEGPLHARRKITHSRHLFKRPEQKTEANESKQQSDCNRGGDNLSTAVFAPQPYTWSSDVVMKPIQEVARELENQGWKIIWQSEVEALAIKGSTPEAQDVDIVELLDMLGVKLKKVGKEYLGLCPFHDDHKPSLSVNREKGLWHCFGCGKGGDANKFVEDCQKLS